MLGKAGWLTDVFYEVFSVASMRSVYTNGGWCVKLWARNHLRGHHVCILLKHYDYEYEKL